MKINSYLNLFPKTINAGITLTSYMLSSLLKRPIIWGMPFFFSIEPTNLCNLRCPECPSGNGTLKRKRGKMKKEDYCTILDKIAPYTLYLTLYFQGEPLLHPDFCYFIQEANKRHILTATSTNGQLLTNNLAKEIVLSGLHKIIVSIDGTTQNTYEKYRVGVDLNTAINGIKYLSKWKKALKSKYPIIELQFLIMRQNEHQINDIKLLAKELHVDKLSLKTAQIINYKEGSNLIPTQEKYSRYIQNGNFYKRKKKIKNKCIKIFCGATITINGDVLPCSFDKDAEFIYGNLLKEDESLKSIWDNESTINFKRKILKNKKACSICNNCAY